MRIMILSLVLFIFCIISQARSEEKRSVFHLTNENFDDFINSHEFVVVMFTEDWCSHCTKIKPIYYKASALLRREGKTDRPVTFAMINYSANQVIGDNYQIRSFPSFRIFRNGTVYLYTGPFNDENEIVKYLTYESSSDWQPRPSKVHDLNRDTIDEFIEKNKYAMINFYRAECKPCQGLAPSFETAATWLFDNQKLDPTVFGKIEISLSDAKIMKRFNITSFPTLLQFRSGRFTNYHGAGGPEDIVDYILKMKNLTSKEVKSFNQFKNEIKHPENTYVLGLFNDKKSCLYNEFTKFGSIFLNDLKLFHTFDTEDFLKYLKTDVKVPSIIVYYNDLIVPSNEPKFRAFSEPCNGDSIENFIFSQSVPLVGFYNKKNQDLIYEKIRPLCYVVFDYEIDFKQDIIELRDKVLDVARKHYLKFVLVNDEQNVNFVEKYQLHDFGKEINVVCIDHDSNVFIYDNKKEDLAEKAFNRFIKNFLDGKLKPTNVKSEKLPKNSKNLAVKKVVGRTFNNFVEDKAKNVFISFIGQSKFRNKQGEFEANLNKITSDYLGKKDLAFGIIDVSKNDIPAEFDAAKTTTSIYYIPLDKKQKKIVFKVEDNTTFEELEEFIKSNIDEDPKAEEQKVEVEQVNTAETTQQQNTPSIQSTDTIEPVPQADTRNIEL